MNEALLAQEKQSTCPRGAVGAVITMRRSWERREYLLAGGWNGAPDGVPCCSQVNCRQTLVSGCRNALHAEVRALREMAAQGVRPRGRKDDYAGIVTLWTSMSPCPHCALLAVEAGVHRVYYRTTYRDPAGIDILREAGLEVGVFTVRPEPPAAMACPQCGGRTEHGYGFAFGGLGGYSYCLADGCGWHDKTEDEEVAHE